MKTRFKRTFVILLISLAFTIASQFFHFRVFAATDLITYQPFVQENTFCIPGVFEVKEAKGTI